LAADLQVVRASGGVRVFVDQAVEDGFSADLMCVGGCSGRGDSVGFAGGDALGDAMVGRAVL